MKVPLSMAALVLLASPALADCPPRAAIERDLIDVACTAPLAPGFHANQAVTSIAELEEQVAQIAMPVRDYPGAYGDLMLTGQHAAEEDATVITYELASRPYEAWAYANVTGASRAALIVPGSGFNQSREIFRRDPANYQYDVAGVVESEGWDAYIYIKPNEDCLAIHNGSAKLSNDCLIPRLLNEGNSYSARYLVDVMAWIKHLKDTYTSVVVIGLSQGGTAALLTALECEPDGAFVASGWSILSAGCSGLAQIVLPGVAEDLAPQTIHDRILARDSRYTFCWGTGEQGAYGYDARCGLTEAYLADLRNVTCVRHAGGHEYPEKGVIHFLRQFTGVEPTSFALYQNYPNPFSRSTTIAFSAPSGLGTLSIFDPSGRLVRVLSCTGDRVQWDGSDRDGRRLPAGVYAYRLGDVARKMILAK